jgi:hypothetical protein
MNYGTTDGVLKPLNEALLPDPRFKFFRIGSDDFMRSFELADLHERINLSKLDAAVPEAVRRQFETAKNLMLYSWFIFEFHTIAELHAYASLEFALRTRFPDAKRKRMRKGREVLEPLTLGPLLRMAVKEGVIVAETLPAWERAKSVSEWYQKRYDLPSGAQRTSTEWLQLIIEHIPTFRNTLAHGNPQLYLEASFRQLETCADLINQLFSSPTTEKENRPASP